MPKLRYHTFAMSRWSPVIILTSTPNSMALWMVSRVSGLREWGREARGEEGGIGRKGSYHTPWPCGWMVLVSSLGEGEKGAFANVLDKRGGGGGERRGQLLTLHHLQRMKEDAW